MRQWRVGTLSMAILLMTLGVVLLVGGIGGYPNYIEQIMKWWPVILILLGVEILCYIYFSKQDQPKVKYDGFSIFVVIVICLFSLSFYTLTATEVIPHIATMVSSQEYSVPYRDERIAVSSEIKKIVIETAGNKLDVKRNQSKEVVILGRGVIFAPSQEKAEDIMNMGKVTVREVGDTLFVQLNHIPRTYHLKPGAVNFQYTLFIPENQEIEIKNHRDYNNLIEIDGEAVKGNWIVDTCGRVKVKIKEEDPIFIEAVTDYANRFKGNVEWNIHFKENTQIHIGSLAIGEGKNKLNIFSRGDVEVNYIEN